MAAEHANPDKIRALFSRAMSVMYREEVPAYGTLMELVHDVNAEVLSASPAERERLEGLGELERHEGDLAVAHAMPRHLGVRGRRVFLEEVVSRGEEVVLEIGGFCLVRRHVLASSFQRDYDNPPLAKAEVAAVVARIVSFAIIVRDHFRRLRFSGLVALAWKANVGVEEDLVSEPHKGERDHVRRVQVAFRVHEVFHPGLSLPLRQRLDTARSVALDA